MINKISKQLGIQPVRSPLDKHIFGTGAPEIRKNKYQSFSVLSNFAWFLIFSQNSLQIVVDRNKKQVFKEVSLKINALKEVLGKREKSGTAEDLVEFVFF